MTVVHKINKLCRDLDTTFNINKGGCCYLAYLIATLLEEKQIPYKIAIQGECAIARSDCELKSKLCKDDCSKCCWVNNYHILLKANGEYINKIKNHDVLFTKYGNSNDIFEIYKIFKAQWKERYDANNNEKVRSIIITELKGTLQQPMSFITKKG